MRKLFQSILAILIIICYIFEDIGGTIYKKFIRNKKFGDHVANDEIGYSLLHGYSAFYVDERKQIIPWIISAKALKKLSACSRLFKYYKDADEFLNKVK